MWRDLSVLVLYYTVLVVGKLEFKFKLYKLKIVFELYDNVIYRITLDWLHPFWRERRRGDTSSYYNILDLDYRLRVD